MASSNRHWPSMFKSKPCNNQEWSQPHDTNNYNQPSILSNNSCARSSSTHNNSPFSSVCEERSPEPKPRWNPKPEQIRILEAIFNSGMVNPPRDEIRRIRAQLQEYGQVGDANVFYWFQNRKSRSKHKQRTLEAKITATKATTKTIGTHHSPPLAASSSSSSEKASPQKVAPSPRSGGGSSSYGSSNNSTNNSNVVVEQFGNSPTSVNQSSNTYFHQLVSPHHNNHTPSTTTTLEFVHQEPLFFPLHQSGASVGNFSQGLCFGTSPQHDGGCGGGGGGSSGVGSFSSFFLGDMLGGSDDHLKRVNEVEKLKFQHELSMLGTSPPNVTTCTISPSPTVLATPSSAISSSLGQILGLGEGGVLAGKSTVLINGMAIEVPIGPLNIKEEFGEDAMLIHSSGHPVATNEWGITLYPLQNGASYYLVGSVAASPLLEKLDTTPDVLAPGFPYQI